MMGRTGDREIYLEQMTKGGRRSENSSKEICLRTGPAGLEVGGAADALRQERKQRA